jgi:hypothetical protein
VLQKQGIEREREVYQIAKMVFDEWVCPLLMMDWTILDVSLPVKQSSLCVPMIRLV